VTTVNAEAAEAAETKIEVVLLGELGEFCG
jgi:hypothetical protein